ncbi:EscJ/YscJ/HrcJ family type III secretion inner membrane ring protein, partial [Pseudomonas syringae pv. tagetis]
MLSLVFVLGVVFLVSSLWVSFGALKLVSANMPFWYVLLWVIPAGFSLLVLIVLLSVRMDWRN